MKQRLTELLKERGIINITELPGLMPEIKGEFAIYMPVKEGFNPNVLWLSGVSNEFIEVFNELLITDEVLDWKPESIFSFLSEGSPVYSMKVAGKSSVRGTKERWLPISIFLKDSKEW